MVGFLTFGVIVIVIWGLIFSNRKTQGIAVGMWAVVLACSSMLYFRVNDAAPPTYVLHPAFYSLIIGLVALISFIALIILSFRITAHQAMLENELKDLREKSVAKKRTYGEPEPTTIDHD